MKYLKLAVIMGFTLLCVACGKDDGKKSSGVNHHWNTRYIPQGHNQCYDTHTGQNVQAYLCGQNFNNNNVNCVCNGNSCYDRYTGQQCSTNGFGHRQCNDGIYYYQQNGYYRQVHCGVQVNCSGYTLIDQSGQPVRCI